MLWNWVRISLLLATASALAGSCADVGTLATPDDVMMLAAELAAIPAYGFSTTTITARISPQAEERFRDVVFTTTMGSFPAGDPDDESTIVATVDTSGTVSVTLQASPQTGTASVTAEIRDGRAVKVARAINVEFEPLAASDVISIQAMSSTAPADGMSVTDIVARIASGVPIVQRSVVFTTTAGSFGPVSPTQRTQAAGSDNLARVGLISPREPGFAVVSAILNGREARAVVEFKPALPDGIAVSVFGNLQMTATFATKSVVEAELFRTSGTVTPGTEVIFRAFDETTGNQFGFFSGVTPSDSQGLVRADFTPGNTIERGEATIRVRIPGTGILGRVRIEIVDPWSQGSSLARLVHSLSTRACRASRLSTIQDEECRRRDNA